MNADRLLAQYEKIANASDAIARLRRFILDLAVRGKLVAQDASDEPASELLRRIAKEKTRLATAGEIRKPPALEPIIDFEVLYALPATWSWVRVGEIFDYDAGTKRDPKELDRSRWLLELEDIEKDTSRLVQRLSVKDRDSQSTKSEFERGDILYGKLRPYLNKVVVADERGYSTTEIVAIRPFLRLCPEYCALAFRRPDFVAYVERLGRGTKMPRLRTPDAIVAPFPLPPLAEQHRIVAKVDEMMGLCDRLEAARAGREAVRDRLAAASLARLNVPDPETFQSDARFALDALPALTTRPDQIKALRQTILNLAVRGKLVPQDPNDEPASELLKRIAAEFEKGVRDGVLNKRKPVKTITDHNQLFPLPSRWGLARFNQVASIQSNLVDPKRYKEMPHIAPDNIEGWSARLLPYTSIGEAGVFSGKHHFSAGAVLYSKIRPNLAKVTRVDFDGLCSADMYPIHALIHADFLVIFMITPTFVSQAVSEDNRVAMPKINQAALSDILVPVPPLAEQRRIVAKVDALMALCDRLEKSLTAAADTRRRLLDALLAEALAPAQDRVLEAAA